jgi:hypothetical protein
MGIVPTPKSNIYKTPNETLCMAMAPKMATYTIPQGKNPFNKPIVNKEE